MIGYQRAPRPSGRLLRKTTLAWALAAALGMTAAAGSAQAARLGHARVVSAPGAPLQVLVPLIDLAPDEAANLRVSLADASAWQQAGLRPPTPPADMHATLEAGPGGGRQVLVTSSQPPATDAIDVLLDMQSNAGQRELQVTVLVPADDISAGIRQARAGGAHGAGAAGAVSAHVKVLPDQTLWGIASSHAVADATIYQELVALWRANPQAFIQNNMNLVRTGTTLSLPDAATVQAIDPAEARRIFEEQAAAFRRYRGRLGAGAHGAVPSVRGRAGASGKIGAGQTSNRASAPSTQDQLRLSTSSQADAKADASTSTQHAMQDASKRIQELQSNVQALNQAAGAAQQGAAGSGQGGASSPSGASSSPSGAANGANGAGGAAGGTTSGAAGSTANGVAGSTTNGATNGQPGGAANGASAAGGSTASGTAATPPVTGPSSPTATALDEAKDTAKKVVSKSGLADWLPDNLLIVVTAVLAIIIFIVAWVMRRAGQRRVDDDDSYGYGGLTPIDDTGGHVDIDHRISNIDLDLDHSTTEDRGRRT